MIKGEKSPLNKHHNYFFRQESLMDTKTGRQKYSEKLMYSLKVSPHKILTLINYKEENSNIIVEKPGKPLLNQGIIVITANNETFQQGSHDMRNKEGYNFSSTVFLPKKEKLEFNHEDNHINPN